MKQGRIFFLGFICLLTACNVGNKNKFTIRGYISKMPVQEVVLEDIGVNDVPTVIDSVKSDEDGSFKLSVDAPEPSIYRLRFQQNKFILLAIDKGEVKVNADWQTIEKWQVSGSPSSESLKKFLVAIREHLRDFITLNVVIDTEIARGNDSLLNKAKHDLNEMRGKFTLFVEHYADTTQYLPVAIFAARILNPASEKPFLMAFSQSLDRRFPNSKMAKDFVANYNKTRNVQIPPPNASPGPELGMQAPDVVLPDINGKDVLLSSMKGKYVLLDFWASWCNPCRMENPNVVAAYNKYKDKNFTVFSVSLDNDKDKWQNAIANDKLSWPTHVADLKGWESVVVRAYRVESIPANFLLDPSGKIIAMNLRGEQLEQKLAEVLK